MKKIFDYYISAHDTDYFRFVAPASYLKIAETACFAAAEQMGIHMQQMIDELDATWMTASVHLEVCKDIYTVGKIEVYAEPLVVNGLLITERLCIFRDGELIAKCDINTLSVNYKTRKVIRPEVVMEHFHVPVIQGEGAFPRLVMPVDSVHVRYSDCDHNQHLRACNYTSYVCDVTGYWAGHKPRKTRHLYMEYLGECRVGEGLALYMADGPEGKYVKGVRSDGRESFKAYFITESF